MRKTTLLTTTLLTMTMAAGPAMAMQPPGQGAQANFVGCRGGQDDAVGGHPGAAGLVHATPRVGRLTGDPLPTAWNAVEHADPIEFGEC